MRIEPSVGIRYPDRKEVDESISMIELHDLRGERYDFVWFTQPDTSSYIVYIKLTFYLVSKVIPGDQPILFTLTLIVPPTNCSRDFHRRANKLQAFRKID